MTNNNQVVLFSTGYVNATTKILKGYLVTKAGVLAGAGLSDGGICGRDADTGDLVEIYPPNEKIETCALSGAAVLVDKELTSDAAGKVVAAAAGDWVVGISITAATGADEFITVKTVSTYLKTA